MKDHENTARAIRERLAVLAEQATDAIRCEYIRGMNVTALAEKVDEIVRLVERHDVQVEYAREMAQRQGVAEGQRVNFAWRDGQQRRRAMVYPNAHTGGATFGLQTNGTDGDYYPTDNFHGAAWTREAACAAAKAWVNDGVMPGEQR